MNQEFLNHLRECGRQILIQHELGDEQGIQILLTDAYEEALANEYYFLAEDARLLGFLFGPENLPIATDLHGNVDTWFCDELREAFLELCNNNQEAFDINSLTYGQHSALAYRLYQMRQMAVGQATIQDFLDAYISHAGNARNMVQSHRFVIWANHQGLAVNFYLTQITGTPPEPPTPPPPRIIREGRSISQGQPILMMRREATFADVPNGPTVPLRMALDAASPPLVYFSWHIPYRTMEETPDLFIPQPGNRISDRQSSHYLSIQEVRMDRNVMDRSVVYSFDAILYDGNSGPVPIDEDNEEARAAFERIVADIQTGQGRRLYPGPARNPDSGQVIQRGDGQPNHNAYHGAIYQDTRTNDLYVYNSGDEEGWILVTGNARRAIQREVADRLARTGATMEEATDAFRRLGDVAAGMVRDIRDKLESSTEMAAKIKALTNNKDKIVIVRFAKTMAWMLDRDKNDSLDFWCTVAEIHNPGSEHGAAIWLEPVFKSDASLIRRSGLYNNNESRAHMIYYKDIDFVRAADLEEYRIEKLKREPRRNMRLKD